MNTNHRKKKKEKDTQ